MVPRFRLKIGGLWLTLGVEIWICEVEFRGRVMELKSGVEGWGLRGTYRWSPRERWASATSPLMVRTKSSALCASKNAASCGLQEMVRFVCLRDG